QTGAKDSVRRTAPAAHCTRMGIGKGRGGAAAAGVWTGPQSVCTSLTGTTSLSFGSGPTTFRPPVGSHPSMYILTYLHDTYMAPVYLVRWLVAESKKRRSIPKRELINLPSAP